jgi:hypothetical protein
MDRVLESLRVQARYWRERRDLYRAKRYAPRPAGPAGLREATTHVHDSAVQRLEEALVEQDRLGVAFDAAVGTSTEFGACVRLQRASEQVAARQTWLNWVDNESYRGINAGPFEFAADQQARACR